VRTIHRFPDAAVRRAAIERMGWLRYVDQAGLRLVAAAPDPANPPHDLRLYDDPEGRLPGVRILVMTNGSPRRGGSLEQFAEPVPARLDDPIAAAAWQYDCPVEVYRALQRRT
jgi:hypothetical protein